MHIHHQLVVWLGRCFHSPTFLICPLKNEVTWVRGVFLNLFSLSTTPLPLTKQPLQTFLLQSSSTIKCSYHSYTAYCVCTVRISVLSIWKALLCPLLWLVFCGNLTGLRDAQISGKTFEALSIRMFLQDSYLNP